MTRWFISPRDPIVTRRTADAPEVPPLPYPNTIAATARAALVSAYDLVPQLRGKNGDEIAQRLLEVAISPPLLARDGDSRTLYARAPQDGVRRRSGLVVKATVAAAETGRGAFVAPLPSGETQLPRWIELPARDASGKAEPFDEHWSLEAQIEWATTSRAVAPPSKDNPIDESTGHIQSETRVHVALTDGVIEPGQLFTSPGRRFGDDMGLQFDVSTPPEWPLEGSGLVTLGGESRISRVMRDDEPAFPDFQCQRKKYQAHASDAGGLRIQILTAAWLRPLDGLAPERSGTPGWLPSWIDERTLSGAPPLACWPQGVVLHLIALACRGSESISGWNMRAGRHGAPRRVRRLVPAGTVYNFEVMQNQQPVDATTLLAVCECLWGEVIEPETSAQASEMPVAPHLLAPPARDGFGLMLPGYWWGSEAAARSETGEDK